MYKYTLYKRNESGFIRNPYYVAVCELTTKKQWAVNILIGLIENIFIEYAMVIRFCHFLVFCPLYIHISIGTIMGTIEYLYKRIINNDDRGLLGYSALLFLLQSIGVFKIGYYN